MEFSSLDKKIKQISKYAKKKKKSHNSISAESLVFGA